MKTSPMPTRHRGHAAVIRRTSLGNGSTIGPGERLDGSLLWENVRIGANAVVSDSVMQMAR